MNVLPMALSPGMAVQRSQQALAVYGLLERTFSLGGKVKLPAAHVQPVRVHLVDTVTADDIEVQFNPMELTRSLGVAYSEHEVAGLGYQPVQYKQTKNQAVRLTLVMRSLGQEGRKELQRKAAFLESLAYPRDIGGNRSAAPPPVLLLWPGYVSMTCIVTEWEEVATEFCSETLEPIQVMVSLMLQELRRKTLTSDQVRRNGGHRWRRS